MDTLVQKFVDWCARKDAAALIEHTVVEGVLGVAVTAVGQIPAPYSLYVVPLSMAVLTPVIAAIGNGGSPAATTATVATPAVATTTETETATTTPVVATEGTTAVTDPTSAVTSPTTTSTDAASVAATPDIPAGTAADGKGE